MATVALVATGLLSPVGATNPNPFGVITHSITLPDTPAPGTTHLYFVHGIPSIGPVDLCADGTTTLAASVGYGAVELVTPAGGQVPYALTLKAANVAPCTGSVLASTSIPGLPDGLDASVVANIAGGTPNLYIIDNHVESAAPNGRLEVYHAANAPTLVVKVDGSAPSAPGPGNPLLRTATPFSVDLPAGDHDITVTLQDGTVVKDLPNTAITAGELLQVFLVGDALFVEPTVPTAPAASPVAGTPKFTG